MNNLAELNLAALTLSELFSSQNLAIMLWLGLATLTIALLILMQTRWGQAAPLSKCIFLSVFAHVLFIAYAYGTKLILDYPTEAEDAYIRLAVLPPDDLRESGESQQGTDKETEPWNQFAGEIVVPPEIDALKRQDVDVDPDETAWSVDAPDFAAEVEPEAIPVIEPFRPQPESMSNAATIREAAPSETEIDNVEANDTEIVQTPTPMTIPLPRQGVPAVDELVTSIEPPVDESRRELFEAPEDLQRLTDVAIGEPNADAQRSNLVDTAASGSVPPTRSDSQSETTPGRDPAFSGDSEPLVEYRISDQPIPIAAMNRRIGDDTPLPDLYSLRAETNRIPLIQRYGGTPETEEAVTAALAWLAKNQRRDGHWDADQFGAGRETQALGHDRRGAGSDADTGITGLALLAMLGAGNSHFEGEYHKNVQLGLEYLLRKQHTNGNLAGDAKLFARMYCHGIASLALSEAFALTGDQRLDPYVRRAIKYTLEAQHPVTGGWRYQPGDRGDMSQFGWQVMALKSAQLAGIEIPGSARVGMLRFLRDASSGTHRGLASYRRGEAPSPTMTAEALVCRYFLGQQGNAASIREATDYVTAELPHGRRPNLYYWYYGTLAMFQTQGEPWQAWNRALQQQLLERQRKSGSLAGSWDTDTEWGGYGGRIYTTAMAALCLEVYYRYLPVYETANRIRRAPSYRR